MALEPNVTLTCPSCRLNREIPREKIPANAVTVRCGGCGHSFSLASQPASPMDFMFENGPATTAAAKPGKVSAKDSSFVTTTAWIFIILSGFATLISILQNVMINTVFPIQEMQKTAAEPGFREMPAFFRFMLGNLRVFFASFLVVTSAMLSASMGLLKRKNWARLVFITLLSLGILWNLAGIFLQSCFMQDFPGSQMGDAEFQRTFNTMRNVMLVFTTLFSLGMSVLFGWLIKKLASAEIRREFR